MENQVVKRRQFLDAAQHLAKASAPSADHIIAVCHTLGALLSDLTGDNVVIAPERIGATDTEALTAADYELVLAEHRRLVRELDVLLNGEAGAAKQATLSDIVAQLHHDRIRAATAEREPSIVRPLFEHWASHPMRSTKLPLEKHSNGAYSDPRTYAAFYGWMGYAKTQAAIFKRPENIDPFADSGEVAAAAAYERLRLASVLQQPAPVPDQMALVWRADLMRVRHDAIRFKSCFDLHSTQTTEPAPITGEPA